MFKIPLHKTSSNRRKRGNRKYITIPISSVIYNNLIKKPVKNIPVAIVKPNIRQPIVEQTIIPTDNTIDLTVEEVHVLPPAVENLLRNLSIETIQID